MNVIKGDITNLGFHVDIIVNAANKHLVGGAGVDGAIHSVGGPEIANACKERIEQLQALEEGDVVSTTAGNLDADFVFHAVGPMVRKGVTEEKALSLRECYKRAILLADMKGCKSIAFPNISTGVYGYPKVEAFNEAVTGICEGLSADIKHIETIYFVCFDDENYSIYMDNLEIALSKYNKVESNETELLAEAFNNAMNIYVNGVFTKGEYVAVHDKLYTFREATHLVTVPQGADLSEVDKILKANGVKVAMWLYNNVSELLLRTVFKETNFDDLHVFDISDNMLRDCVYTYLVMVAPRLIGTKIEDNQIPLLLLCVLYGIEEVVIEGYKDRGIDIEIEEEPDMNLWDKEKDKEHKEEPCACGCNCTEDCDCDCDCEPHCTCADGSDFDFEEDLDRDFDPGDEPDCGCCNDCDFCFDEFDNEAEKDTEDINLFGTPDFEDDENDLCDCPFCSNSALSASQKIGSLVSDMVNNMGIGLISSFNVKVDRDYENGYGFKVDFTVTVE